MVKIIYNYNLSKLDKKLVNVIMAKILNTTFRKHYNFSYYTQKYNLKEILTKIMYVLYKCNSWRQLGICWNNVYKHYIKLNKFGIFKKTYADLLKTYLEKNKNSLKIVSIDTTIIYNKYGTDNLAINKFAKNKKCLKLFTAVDSKKKPIYFACFPGNMNDSGILNTLINDLMIRIKDKTKICLADSGFCSKENREKFKENGILPLIPLNVRNMKKDKPAKNMTYIEKINMQLMNFNNRERKIYKKRICVENFYASYKQPPKLATRYEKYFKNLEGFISLYMARRML